jgi:hypothetical protein
MEWPVVHKHSIYISLLEVATSDSKPESASYQKPIFEVFGKAVSVDGISESNSYILVTCTSSQVGFSAEIQATTELATKVFLALCGSSTILSSISTLSPRFTLTDVVLEVWCFCG